MLLPPWTQRHQRGNDVVPGLRDLGARRDVNVISEAWELAQPGFVGLVARRRWASTSAPDPKCE